MMPMLTTTYGESVTCTPSARAGCRAVPSRTGRRTSCGRASRRRTARRRVSRISAGRPSCWSGRHRPRAREQMKVRDSTRATSSGSLRARKLYGRCSGLSWMSGAARRPCARSSSSCSAREPSHQTTASGVVRCGHLLDPGDDARVGAARGAVAASCTRGRRPALGGRLGRRRMRVGGQRHDASFAIR